MHVQRISDPPVLQKKNRRKGEEMKAEIDARLEKLGIALPAAAAPAANYVPTAQAGSLLYVSGQLPVENGKLAQTGQLGAGVTVAEGQRAAELCAINILAQASAALDGDLSRIVRIVRLNCAVSSTPDFYEQHLVANGASNLLVEVLGDAGRHSRVAVGMAALPLNASVEIDAILDIR
jgi:enamine deaminase RidA (YjgF/YER057c/UK114 family)